jgi:predicted phage terminase large subunit-like protein
MTPQEAAAELLARRAAKAGMREYRQYMAASGHSDFQHSPARHHSVIIDACERLSRGESKRVLIMAPPGSAKSTYTSIQFATHYLANNPTHRILCCSNTTELAEEFNRRRRSAVMTDEWQALAQTSIDPNDKGVSRFGTLAGGSVHAAGVGSAIVGLRSNLNVLDDPVRNFEEAMSESQLSKQASWYFSEFRSRLIPGGAELVITTRWSRNDIAGIILRLAEKGEEEWEVIRLPMLADREDDPIGRALGEPLWPQWFTDSQIRENQRDPLRWQAMYQQTPLNQSGSWVPMENVLYEDTAPEKLTIVIAMDLALSVGKGDFTVFVVCGIDETRRIHVLEVIRERSMPDETVYRLFSLHNKYPDLSMVLIEDDPQSKVFMRLFYEIARREGRPVPLRPITIGSRDKETRAAAIRGFFLQNAVRIVCGSWNGTLAQEISEFPAGDHDDQIDCLGMIGRALATMSAPIPTPMQNRPTFEGAVVMRAYELPDGRVVHHPHTRASLEDMFQDREDGRGRLSMVARRRI